MTLQPKTFTEAQERTKRYAENRRAKLAIAGDFPKNSHRDSRRAFEEATSRATAKKQASRLKRGGKLGSGKKTKRWASVRAGLKKRFAAAGITHCELFGVLPHLCSYDDYLGFAHNAKRRKLTDADLYHVILACNPGHDIIEHWQPEEMKAIVNSVIHRREKQP